MKDFLKLGMKKAHSLGITSCGSYDSSGPDFDKILGVYRDIYDESLEAGLPALRLTMQCGISAKEELLDSLLGRFNSPNTPLWQDSMKDWGTFLSMGPVKLFADGTLGGQTAWMREPYLDKPETRGFPAIDEISLNRFVQKASARGMQVLIHAIGDAGIDAVISAFEKVTSLGKNPLRHGIIHCQVTTADLLERMARNKILGLVQPVFLADDMHIVSDRVGPALASTSYAWGTMERLGVPVSYGTDAPVGSLDPLLGMEWAVLRRGSGGPSSAAFYPDERVDVYSAVVAYTIGSAYSGFEEHIKGRIAPGFLADLVFLDKDIFTIQPDEIHKARVLRTICAGETVYQ
jgi:predicted amidohydrolase YtcJ